MDMSNINFALLTAARYCQNIQGQRSYHITDCNRRPNVSVFLRSWTKATFEMVYILHDATRLRRYRCIRVASTNAEH